MGHADEQVALQVETIDRQLKGLTADLQKFVQQLSKAGANNYIKDIIKDVRTLVQVLGYVRPSNMSVMANTIKIFVGLKLAIVAVRIVTLSLIPTLNKVPAALTTMTAAAKGTTVAITGTARAFKTLTAAVGWIGLIIVALETLYDIYDAWNQKQQEVENSNRVKENIDKQIQAYHDLSDAIEANDKVKADSNATDEEKKQALDAVSDAENRLREVIGDEAYAQLMASGDVKKAMQIAINALNAGKKAELDKSIATAKSEIEQSNAVIQGVSERLKMYQEEINGIQEVMAARHQGYENAGFFEKLWIKAQDKFDEARLWQLNKFKEKADDDYNEATSNVAAAKNRLQIYQAELAGMSSDVKIPGGDVDSNEYTPTETNGHGNNGEGAGNGSGKDYAEKAERLKYQKRKNELWYDAEIAAKKYDMALKDLEADEDIEGVTAKTVSERNSLYQGRIQELEEYKAKLSAFQKDLMTDLDNKMKENPEIAKDLGYNDKATDEQKIRLMNINKETFQQMETFTEISKSIDEVNKKLVDTDDKLKDINITIRKTRLSQAPDEVYKRIQTDLENDYNINNANRGGYNDIYETQKGYGDKLEYLKALLKAQRTEWNKYNKDLEQMSFTASETDYRKVKETLDKVTLEMAKTEQEIRQTTLDTTKTVREGLAGVTQSFIVDGDSWSDIWKNLWNDLAKEAINALFKVQGQVSLLGQLMQNVFGGGIGGGSTASTVMSVGSLAVPGYSFGVGAATSHKGSVIANYPKMHTGGLAASVAGDVVGGQKGVVPTLKDDEVVRTLQVGEEVNSMAERRSNEILGAVAMKAMDEKAKTPTNVQITALDSKSFAEYLSDNADILLAVLAKNKALGRG